MLEFARENCKKTCGFCTDDTGKHLPDICLTLVKELLM
ncbi:hypothetical protein OESDEN_21494 [Oesophagostomum dentatum]|uniref:ShKT domain-containing protein n=1 Tax=Oesophagostomum dentatum TaxID=61180 RepID=A0A0B1S0K4_OESDE|nr:hypothetical protein OESDEN_21494 [Oesophagostomum dentatum]